jgi:hypothetical protein
MPRVGFELTISAGERPQTYALDRAAIATVRQMIIDIIIVIIAVKFIFWQILSATSSFLKFLGYKHKNSHRGHVCNCTFTALCL